MKFSFVIMTGMLSAAAFSSAEAGNVSFGYSQSVVSTGGYAAPVYTAPAPVAYGTTQRYCREYNGQALVAGRYQQTYGTACMQPDGSWQIQTPNGVGTTLDYIPPPAAYNQPVTYYNPPTYYAPAPVYYGAPSYPYSRSSFSISVGGNNWDRHRRGYYHNHRHRDDDDWKRRVWRDDWHKGRGRGHGRGHHGGHWR